MVLKQARRTAHALSMFENDVEMYGAQTLRSLLSCRQTFENDVEMYGAQTQSNCHKF